MLAPVSTIPEAVFDSPPFRTTRAAVRFAVTRFGYPGRPAMSRMADPTIPDASLGGLDGAAQAGFISQILSGIGSLNVAIVTASVAPVSLPCACRRPCCSGHYINADWRLAVEEIAGEAGRGPLVEVRSAALLFMLVARAYGKNARLTRVADLSAYSPDHVARVNKHLGYWLYGFKKSGAPEIVGVDSTAWNAADVALRDYGVVGDPV